MDLLGQFKKYIQLENLFSSKDLLLLAVSGGVDSVVLCELCKQAGYDFVIAHCNFQLRGEESARDEAFVRKLAAQHSKQVLVKAFDTETYAVQHKVSVQVAARLLRYAWFDELLALDSETVFHKNGLQNFSATRKLTYLLTAHHLDDNIETMLLNFFKGTGIAGLRGMVPRQGKIVRPLLFAKKEDLQQFAITQQLNWVEDSSNQSDKYSRNYFRNQVIPMIKNIYPEAETRLSHNLQRFKETEILYLQSVDQHKKKLLEYRGNEVHIPVLKLQKAVPLSSIVYEIIKVYNFGPPQVAQTIALLESETGRFLQSASHRIIRNRKWLIISPHPSTAVSTILIEAPGKIEFETGRLEIELVTDSAPPVPASQNCALLDAGAIVFPLLLRKWKTGDYFYPLGMRKKKKLARFFIDQKLSKTAKEGIWVLECNKKICWVLGQRIDDRYKITTATTNVLRLLLHETVHI